MTSPSLARTPSKRSLATLLGGGGIREKEKELGYKEVKDKEKEKEKDETTVVNKVANIIFAACTFLTSLLTCNFLI